MISRSNMGKQLTGNRTKKMAAGGKASQSKSAGSKSVSSRAAPAKSSPKTGGSAAGKTLSSTGANRGGGKGFLGGLRSAVSNIGKDFKASLKPSPTVTDPKTGQTFDRPNYRGMSVKGLTSTDPANVARNREAAARYAAQEAARSRPNANGGNMGHTDPRKTSGVVAGLKKDTASSPGSAVPPTMGTAPSTGMVMPPPGYRPGIDPEWNYRPQQTVVMKKGGKVKPKGKKK